LDRFKGAFTGDGNWTSTRRYYVTQDNDLIDNSNKHRTNGCIAVAIQESGFESSRCQMLLKAIG